MDESDGVLAGSGEVAERMRQGAELVVDVWCGDGFGRDLAVYPELLDTVLVLEQFAAVEPGLERRYRGQSGAGQPDTEIVVGPGQPCDASLALEYREDRCEYRVDRVEAADVPVLDRLSDAFHTHYYRIREDDGEDVVDAYASARAWQTMPDPRQVGLFSLELDVGVYG